MRKRTTIRIISFLSAGVAVAAALAFLGWRRSRSLELYAKANAQHAFDELVTNVTELSNALEKSLYVTDPALESALCTQIFARAATAQMAAGELPYSSQELEKTTSFLSRAGDFACVLSRTVGGSGGYSEEELQALADLSETASVMALNLRDMQSRILAGALTMEEVYAASDAVEASDGGAPLAGTAFQTMEAEFPEIPTLIYDGPFSDAMTSAKPVFLEGRTVVDESRALRAAAEFLHVDETELEALGEVGGKIPCFCFSSYAGGGEYTVYVTKQGGEILSMLCSRQPGRERVSAESAVRAARAFLEERGLRDMEDSYHMAEGGVLTVNFAYVQDGVMCYPDLVKVGVALDSGAIVSYDANGYLSSHAERELPETEISVDKALETVSPLLTVRSYDMALIPSDGGEERLCHELVCESEEQQRYLLYVNAVTGAQERILILLEDESGTLTI